MNVFKNKSFHKSQLGTTKQRGAMLIEVLVSILIFSFGLLGLVGLQAVASQNSVNAQDRTTAANIANDMVTEMWLRNTSNTANLAAQITAWQARVIASNLPAAAGTVATDVNNITTVTIQWRPTARRAGESDSRYETQVIVN